MNHSLISFLTLYKKEVQRFTKIPLQTIAAPAAKETDIKSADEEETDKETSDESEDKTEENNWLKNCFANW